MRSKWLSRKVFVFFILLTTLFSLVACGKKEQGKQPNFPVTEYVSSSELFNLYIPTGWSSEEVILGADLVMANTEAALERNYSDGTIESGDLVLNIGFLPVAFFREKELSHLEIQIEASPDAFLQSLLPMFHVEGDPAGNVIGQVTLVSLGDGRDAGRLTFSKDGYEGLILVFKAGKDVFAIVSAVTYPGGLRELQETIYDVAAGVAYDGSQNALYSKLYGD